MNSPTVLVIDDSSTIRKLVDSHLTQEGYRVILAPTAEEGVARAQQHLPDLILLDHQLPGTTGIEVCRQIIQIPECTRIPFIVSSTLRKQAYIEYMDIPNVVDSLPKPFKPELLKMTVANALETGEMIISSQTSGTAVPEVIDKADQPAFSGEFQQLGLREVIDFLNNGEKRGLLEVESDKDRVWFYLDGGRIQCVLSSSIPEESVAQSLPESLKDLAPLLRFTMSSGFSAHVEGLVQLMDKKMLDPRMLRSLLRHQASVLTRICFQSQLNSFSFYADRPVPPLFKKSGLETSLAALLVEGVMDCPLEEITAHDARLGWVRHGLRGQNLDRTGLSARQIRILSALDTSPVTVDELAGQLESPPEEIRRVLEGFQMAEWVRSEVVTVKPQVLALESDSTGSALLRRLLSQDDFPFSGKVIRDQFGLQLLLKRMQPQIILVQVDDAGRPELPENMQSFAGTVCVILSESDSEHQEALQSFPILRRPYGQTDVLQLLESLGQGSAGLMPELSEAGATT